MMDSKNAGTRSVAELRSQARDKLSDGAVTSNYGVDVAKAVELLNDALATEIVCVLRYKVHYVAAQGIDSEAVKAEFLQHANEEQAHADLLAARINQLGGKPNTNSATVAARSATEYCQGKILVEMLTEDLVASELRSRSTGTGCAPSETGIRRHGE